MGTFVTLSAPTHDDTSALRGLYAKQIISLYLGTLDTRDKVSFVHCKKYNCQHDTNDHTNAEKLIKHTMDRDK